MAWLSIVKGLVGDIFIPNLAVSGAQIRLLPNLVV